MLLEGEIWLTTVTAVDDRRAVIGADKEVHVYAVVSNSP